MDPAGLQPNAEAPKAQGRRLAAGPDLPGADAETVDTGSTPRARAPRAEDLVVRPATPADLDGLYSLAARTDGTITGVPPDREQFEQMLLHGKRSLSRTTEAPSDQSFLLVLEDRRRDAIIGMGKVRSQPGGTPPSLYSYRFAYRVARSDRWSEQQRKRVTGEVLLPVTDLDSHSEVGSLFLSPDVRGGGLGRLIARSRYLFIAQHRRCFAERIMSDMRGYHYARGKSAFWDAVGQTFFDMEFLEADAHNSRHGSRFIVDLLPQHPIPTGLLPKKAQEAVGRPHSDGEQAMKLLREEGLEFDQLVNIFDAGPILTANTDRLRAVREAELSLAVCGATTERAEDRLVAAHQGSEFRLVRAPVAVLPSEVAIIPQWAADSLRLQPGQTVRHAPF